MRDYTFKEWKDLVDDWLRGHIGLISDDLPDQPYYDWFDDGIDPNQAGQLALEGAL
jgi:hypothetical protein